MEYSVRMTKTTWAVAAGATLLWAGTVLATPTAQQKCEAAKNAAAGKYAACLQTAKRTWS